MPGCSAHPGARLVVAAGGDDRRRLEAKAADLELGRRVFTGFTSEATLAELYRRCAAFAMPSRGEGFGLVYLEAMRAGEAGARRPRQRRRGDRDRRPDRPAGRSGRPRRAHRRALVRLLEQPGDARRMGEAGRERWRRETSAPTVSGAGAALDPLLERSDALMCGINGILRLSDAARRSTATSCSRTRDAMTARGPDGSGAWISRATAGWRWPAGGSPSSTSRRPGPQPHGLRGRALPRS